MFYGSITAIITPFSKGSVDHNALTSLVEWQISSGTQAIVVCGTTGEGVLLTPLERQEVVQITLKACQGRIPVIVGCSAPSTWETIALVQESEAWGAQGALVLTPYYVRPSQKGLVEHFKAVAAASSLPLILYNNPGRVGTDISLETIKELAEVPTIVGLKECNGDLTRLVELRGSIHPFRKDFVFLAGDDPTLVPYLANGGDGCISIAANVIPQHCRALIDAWIARDEAKLALLRDALLPLQKAMVLETNPTPAKYAVSLVRQTRNEVRLPLQPVGPETEKKIQEALKIAQSVNL